MFRREHALLFWTIEGGEYLRAHEGGCYLYHSDGAFVAYKGIPPEATFGRVKRYLLQLEGLFRLLPRDVQRRDGDLLAAIQTSMSEYDSIEDYLAR
jgi:hypothetical protein